MCFHAACRRARTESPPASSTCGCRSSSSAPQIRNEPTSMNSAAGAPAAATTAPPSAGPATNAIEKPMFSAALRLAFCLLRAVLEAPHRNLPRRPAVPRPDRARPAPPPRAAARWRPAPPSRRAPPGAARPAARSATASTASAAVATASKKYSALSSLRRADASTRAISAGTRNAGSACQANSSAATASALWVWSNTASDSATRPTHDPEPVDRVGGDDPAQPRRGQRGSHAATLTPARDGRSAGVVRTRFATIGSATGSVDCYR